MIVPQIIPHLVIYIIWTVIILRIFKIISNESHRTFLFHVCAYVIISLLMMMVSTIIVFGCIGEIYNKKIDIDI
jgi:hypothetical protein